jgi:prepilin-type N-terminal cleavage/methylation domain-containing protein/prepilin-type processing-associated H-X9-DG protein
MIFGDGKIRMPAGSKQGGFTLVELLVVIAIIALLAGLLLPVLSHGKQAAQEAICRNNLHQIGVGFMLYLDENNSTFPSSGWGTLKEDWIFHDRHRQYFWFKLSNPDIGTIHRLLGRNSTNTFRCPGDRDALNREHYRRGIDDVNFAAYAGYPFSYSLTDLRGADFVAGKIRNVNYMAGLASSETFFFRISSVVNPANKIMLCEEDTIRPRANGVDLDGGSWHPFFDPLSGRHHRRSTMGMVDGHVESELPEFGTKPEHYSPRYAP